MPEQDLEDRVAYLEENIRKLNKAVTDTAAAVQALLAVNQAKCDDLSSTLTSVRGEICPFPPGC